VSGAGWNATLEATGTLAATQLLMLKHRALSIGPQECRVGW
jgi:hypothetical protein